MTLVRSPENKQKRLTSLQSTLGCRIFLSMSARRVRPIFHSFLHFGIFLYNFVYYSF